MTTSSIEYKSVKTNFRPSVQFLDICDTFYHLHTQSVPNGLYKYGVSTTFLILTRLEVGQRFLTLLGCGGWFTSHATSSVLSFKMLVSPSSQVVVVDSPTEIRCLLSTENTKLTAVPSATISEIRQVSSNLLS